MISNISSARARTSSTVATAKGARIHTKKKRAKNTSNSTGCNSVIEGALFSSGSNLLHHWPKVPRHRSYYCTRYVSALVAVHWLSIYKFGIVPNIVICGIYSIHSLCACAVAGENGCIFEFDYSLHRCLRSIVSILFLSIIRRNEMPSDEVK